MSTYVYVYILIYVYIHMYIYIYMCVCVSLYLFLFDVFLLVCVCAYVDIHVLCIIYIYLCIYLKRYSDWISGKRSTRCGVNQACFSADLYLFFTVLKWLNWLIHPAMIGMLRPGEIRLSPRGLGMFGHHSDDCCDLMTCDGGACENHNGFGPCVLFYGDQSCAVWCSYA